MFAYHMQVDCDEQCFIPLRSSNKAVFPYRIALRRSHAEIAVGDTQVAAVFGADCRPTWEDGW